MGNMGRPKQGFSMQFLLPFAKLRYQFKRFNFLTYSCHIKTEKKLLWLEIIKIFFSIKKYEMRNFSRKSVWKKQSKSIVCGFMERQNKFHQTNDLKGFKKSIFLKTLVRKEFPQNKTLNKFSLNQNNPRKVTQKSSKKIEENSQCGILGGFNSFDKIQNIIIIHNYNYIKHKKKLFFSFSASSHFNVKQF